MVTIILTNQLTLTFAILILQSNVLTNSYFPLYPNYSFKSFGPPWRPRRSFITLARARRSFGEGKEGAGKGGCDQRLPAAGAGVGVWRRRACERERKEWREKGKRMPRRGPLLGPAAPCAMARRCRTMICGAAGPPRHDLWRGRAGPHHRSAPRSLPRW